MTALPRRVAILVKGYPRLSETFIAQELLALERLGLDLEIVSLRHPTDGRVHPLHEQIRAPVRYLPEYLYQEPLAGPAGAGAGGPAALVLAAAAGLAGRPRPRLPRPTGAAGSARPVCWRPSCPTHTDWLHVHYLHTPASVARYAAILRGLPFSISAHAKDVWTIPDWEKREKIAAARWLVTCSRMNLDHLRGAGARGRPGAGLSRPGGRRAFPPPSRRPGGDGSDPHRPVGIVCVARAVEKKGLDVLLEALARLPPDLHWRFEHVGGGPLADELKAQARRLGLADRIAWRGAGTQDEVLAALRRADLFCLAARDRRRRRSRRPAQRDHGGDVAGAAGGGDRGRRHRRGGGRPARPAAWCRPTTRRRWPRRSRG